MFIGISGYTRPEDKYDALLPPVSSWTLDRRKKAARKNNFAGGFSASVNKNDEYRFYSTTWEELTENDISMETTGTDMYESISKPAAAITNINTTDTTLFITPVKSNIPAGTHLWVLKAGNVFHHITLSANYVSGSASMLVSATTPFTASNTDLIVLHKSRGLGLLSIASLAATGSTHLIRDFMGNLVKIIFQSPKYNALAGTDEFQQMYYDVKLDFDVVADTASNNYVATKGLQVNVTNESLPKASTVASSGGSYDLSSLFIKDGNYYNCIQLDVFQAGTAYTLHTTAPIAPYTPLASSGGVPLLSFSRKIGVFRNYISRANELNLKFVGEDGVIIRDDGDTDNDLEFTLECPEIIYTGNYKPTLDYGVWDAWKAEENYSAGTYVTSTDNKLYVCILEGTKGVPLTDTKSWYRIPDGAPIVVSYEGKYYKLKVAKAKGVLPSDAATWELYNLTGASITFKALDKLKSSVTNNDALILIIQPFSFQDLAGSPNKSSILLRIPIINGPIIQDIDITDQSTITKLASMYPSADDQLEVSYLGNAATLKTGAGMTYYQNNNLGSTVLAYSPTTTGSKGWQFGTELFLPRYNIEQCTSKLVNYTVLNIRGTASTSTTISDGLTRLTVSKDNIHANVTMKYARAYAPVKISGTGSGAVTTAKTLLQSFNLLALDKMVIETIYNPITKQVTQNAYWLSVDKDHENGIIVVKGEPSKSGLSLIKHKSTISFNATETSDSDTTINPTFSQGSAAQYVDLASSMTYQMEPVSQQYIAKFFSIEDGTWV